MGREAHLPARAGLPLKNARAQGARDEIHRQLGRVVAAVENGIDLDDLERAGEAGFGDDLEREVRLAKREPAAYGRPDAGRDVGIENVHVEADMDEAWTLDPLERAVDRRLDPVPVDLAHR